MRLYRFFLDGIPFYLARHYWWAYLWRPAVWFFDHQPVINAILFGQYKKLMSVTMKRLSDIETGNVLQLSCVYGHLTPRLAQSLSPEALHLTDVSDVQLAQVRSKAPVNPGLLVTRMNAEQLAYKTDSFDTVIIFFLLHEMPPQARRNTLAECTRILSSGGRLLITEYGQLPLHHWLYRFPVTRWLLTWLEPFLEGFWNEDMLKSLNDQAGDYGKAVEMVSNTMIFSGFYRVAEFRMT